MFAVELPTKPEDGKIMARAERDADRTSAILSLGLFGLVLLTRRLLTNRDPETRDSARPNRAWILGHVQHSESLRPDSDEVRTGPSLPLSIALR